MVKRRRPNRLAIKLPRTRLAIAEMSVAMLDTKSNSILTTVEDRWIYYVVLMGTLARNTLGSAKIAALTGLDPKTVRRKAAALVDRGIFLYLSDRSYVVNAEFANTPEALARVLRFRKLVEKAHAKIMLEQKDAEKGENSPQNL